MPAPETPDLSEGWGEQRSRLRKELRRFDVLLFLICTLVGLDTIGSVAAQGPQGLTWMAILAVFFFLPYGLLVAELGSAFLVQGGPYVWTRLAFGRLTAGLNSGAVEVRRRAGLHLGWCARRRPVRPDRQVGADRRSRRAHRAARLLPRLGRRLRRPERCARPARG
ncbi:amino acid permease [Streptomyces sp. 5K101]|uniref:amino acid permease n=1 Tax=Streptomyces sp. 5K101 TaxID=3390037 RepID=UPI00397514FE